MVVVLERTDQLQQLLSQCLHRHNETIQANLSRNYIELPGLMVVD
jgi:hypothetical protein